MEWIEIRNVSDIPEGVHVYEYEYDLLHERTTKQLWAGPTFKKAVELGIIIKAKYKKIEA